MIKPSLTKRPVTSQVGQKLVSVGRRIGDSHERLTLVMKLVRFLTAVALLFGIGVVSATSWHDDSHYVGKGPRSGYFIVRPGSKLEP